MFRILASVLFSIVCLAPPAFAKQQEMSDVFARENEKAIAQLMTTDGHRNGNQTLELGNRSRYQYAQFRIAKAATEDQRLAGFLGLDKISQQRLAKAIELVSASVDNERALAEKDPSLLEGELDRSAQMLHRLLAEGPIKNRFVLLSIALVDAEFGKERLPRFCYPLAICHFEDLEAEELADETRVLLNRYNEVREKLAAEKLDELLSKIPEVSRRAFLRIKSHESTLFNPSAIKQGLGFEENKEQVFIHLVAGTEPGKLELVDWQQDGLRQIRRQMAENPKVTAFQKKVLQIEAGNQLRGFDVQREEAELLNELVTESAAAFENLLLPHQLKLIDDFCCQVMAVQAKPSFEAPRLLAKQIDLNQEQERQLELATAEVRAAWRKKLDSLETEYLSQLKPFTPDRIVEVLKQIEAVKKFDLDVDQIPASW